MPVLGMGPEMITEFGHHQSVPSPPHRQWHNDVFVAPIFRAVRHIIAQIVKTFIIGTVGNVGQTRFSSSSTTGVW